MARSIMAQKADKVKKYDIAHSFDVWANKVIDENKRDHVDCCLLFERKETERPVENLVVYRISSRSGLREMRSYKRLEPRSVIMFRGEKGIVVNRKANGDEWKGIW